MANLATLIETLKYRARRVSSDKLLNNIFWNTVARFGSAGLNVVTTVFLMSVLEVEEYGEYVVFFSIYSTIPFFFDFGLNNSFVSLGARFKSMNNEEYPRLISTVFAVKLAILGVIAVVIPLGNFVQIIPVRIAAIILLGAVLGIWEFLLTVFKSHQDFKTLSWLLPVRNLIALAAVMSLYYIFDVRSWTSFLYTIMLIPVMLTGIVYVKYFRQIGLKVHRRMLINTYTVSKWVALFTLITAVHARTDIYLLEYFVTTGQINSRETGIFSAAFSLLAFINLVTSTFAEAVLPKVSEESSPEYFKHLMGRIKRTIPYVVLLAVVLGLVLYPVLFYGFNGKYSDSVDSMVFIATGMIFLFYLHTLNTMFYPLGRTDLIFKVILVMFVVNISLGYILIPVWGAVGAALTNMCVSLVGLFMTLLALNRVLSLKWKS